MDLPPTLFSEEKPTVSPHAPSESERASHYLGIAGEDDCPPLLYCSNHRTVPPSAMPVVKSVYGAGGTTLAKVWEEDGAVDQICAIVKAGVPEYSSVETCRFYTHGPAGYIPNPDGHTDGGSLGPPTLWICVPPGSTSPDAAHEVTGKLLAFLRTRGVDDDTVVEWREGILMELSSPPLLQTPPLNDALFLPTQFLTNDLPISLANEGMDCAGTMSMFFHVGQDARGPTDRVFGLTNCHVLRTDTETDYEFNDGDSKDHVYLCSSRRFQRGLDDVETAIKKARANADSAASGLQGPGADEQTKERLESDLKNLITFRDKLRSQWGDGQFDRNIGHVVYAPAIHIDRGNTEFTADWAAFEASKAQCSAGYKGNYVFLGSDTVQLELLNQNAPHKPFAFPDEGKIRLSDFASQTTLAVLPSRDNLGNECLFVAKGGSTTDLTIGRFSGIQACLHKNGIRSMAYAVYNSGDSHNQSFAKPGDSGSIVWYAVGDQGHIVGQLRSGSVVNDRNGGSHVTYLTPGWWLRDQVLQKFPHADFFRTAW